VTWAKNVLGVAVQIIKRSDEVKGFVVLPRRWVVERSFAHLMRHRRLVRCYERNPQHHEAMIWWATVSIMTRRLTRHLAGEPPHGRWSDPPPLPDLTSPDRRGKVLQLLAAQPWRAWKGSELAAILGIDNVNSFRYSYPSGPTRATSTRSAQPCTAPHSQPPKPSANRLSAIVTASASEPPSLPPSSTQLPCPRLRLAGQGSTLSTA
jgi:hypothetical protein